MENIDTAGYWPHSVKSATWTSGSQQGLAGREAHCLSPRGGRRGGFGGQSLWYCALSWGVGRSGGGWRGCTALIWNSLSLGGGGQTRNSNRNKQEIQFSLKTSISTGSSYYELFNYIFLGIWQKQTYGQRKPNILTQPPPTLAAATWEKVIWPPAENWGGRFRVILFRPRTRVSIHRKEMIGVKRFLPVLIYSQISKDCIQNQHAHWIVDYFLAASLYSHSQANASVSISSHIKY